MSAAATLQQIVPTGTWNADATHSQVDFTVKHLGISTIRGNFPDVSATLTGGEEPTLTGSIRLDSVSTKDKDRDAHLGTPDFFDTERYPKATFVATFISPEKLVGEFTLKGVTREIEFSTTLIGPISDPSGGDRFGIDLEGEIDRRDFGVTFNMPLPAGGWALGNEVKLFASLSFVKEA